MKITNKAIQNMTREDMEAVIQMFNPYMEDYLYIMDLQEDMYSISSHALTRFMLPASTFDQAKERHMSFVYEEDREGLTEDLNKLISGEKSEHNLHYRWLDREGHPVWINCRGGVLCDETGKPKYLIGCINETGQKQRADNVSGLLSALEFSNYIKENKEDLKHGYLMRIGIDDFSNINSTIGVSYGDYVLKNVASCIKECLSSKQHLFHLVSDEYMVVDLANKTPANVVSLYKKIRDKISAFIDEENYKAVFTISAGVVDIEYLSGGYDQMMKLTDFTLKQAKDQSKNCIYVYNEEDYKALQRRKKTIAKLQCSIDNNFSGFEAYYQPIVDTETSKLIGAEALMRFSMQTEEGVKRVSPLEFIPLLEETGLIIPAGKWMLNEAISMCSEMQKYIPGFKININLSFVQVLKSNVLHDILVALDKYQLSPECVGIELTESGYLDSNPHFMKLRDGLRDKGILFIIDDFGTGYSNLHCISDLSPSYIKIDRSFTNKAMSNSYDHELMVKIIEMAHDLDIQICIEGVEEMNVRDEVSRIHADFIQGYLFGMPCAKDEFYQKFVNE